VHVRESERTIFINANGEVRKEKKKVQAEISFGIT
jgi:hypothetical protein